MDKLSMFDELKEKFKLLADTEFELRQYEMVMETGGLTEEEASHLAEGPTLPFLREYRSWLVEQIHLLLKQEPHTSNDVVEVESD